MSKSCILFLSQSVAPTLNLWHRHWRSRTGFGNVNLAYGGVASVARDAKAAIQGRVSFSEAANLAWQGVATVARDAKDSYSKEAERL